MKYTYTDYEQLPIIMNADQVAGFLNISRAGAYQLFHTWDFPSIKIGKRMIVQKDKLLDWLEEQSKKRV